jgi:hypothetical protein
MTPESRDRPDAPGPEGLLMDRIEEVRGRKVAIGSYY